MLPVPWNCIWLWTEISWKKMKKTWNIYFRAQSVYLKSLLLSCAFLCCMAGSELHMKQSKRCASKAADAGAFAAKLAVFEASALPWVVHPSEQCKPQIALSNHWRSCAYYCLLDLCLHKTAKAAKTSQLASTGDAGKNTCGLWESTNKYSHDHNTARNSGTRVRIPAGLLELGKACHLHCCHIQVGPIKLKLSNL